MRIQSSAADSKTAPVQMLPMYFSLSDMVSVWQQFQAQDPKASAAEPAIHLMSLDELVTNMLAGGEVDFKSILLIAASGKEPVRPGAAPPAAASAAAGKPPVTGGTTLGDI